MSYSWNYTISGRGPDAEAIKGPTAGLYGRMPPELQKLVRKIRNAYNPDYAAMQLLDAFKIEWRVGDEHLESVIDDDSTTETTITTGKK